MDSAWHKCQTRLYAGRLVCRWSVADRAEEIKGVVGQVLPEGDEKLWDAEQRAACGR